MDPSCQIGMIVAQNLLLSNCPVDPMSINMKGILICTNGHSNLERACTSLAFELLSQIKRSRSLLFTQTKWKIKRLTSYGLVENDSDLVHGLLEVLSHSLSLYSPPYLSKAYFKLHWTITGGHYNLLHCTLSFESFHSETSLPKFYPTDLEGSYT